MLLPFQCVGCAGQGKMLEYKCHCRVEQLEKVPLNALAVHEYSFVRALETCQPEQALGIFHILMFSKQHGCRIVQHPVFQ